MSTGYVFYYIYLWSQLSYSYAGRACGASTATGSKAQHIRELNALLNDAIST